MFATKPDTSKRSTTKRNVTLKRAAYAVVHVAKSLLSHLALASLFFHQFTFATAFAESLPITPDGSSNTQVTKTASGVDQVNIAAPNSSGLSHNKFTDYNINRSGQVINNFSGKNPAEVVAVSGTEPVTSTKIGGLVTANPNLANSGSASIILNEVTSTNNSQLLGYAEIAGSKAELIISNPNGITCSGCGFINTSRLSLIAGSSGFDQNGNLGFNLKEQANPNLMIPLITVEGLGLDVERATHADIVASAIKLIATTYGSDDTEVTLKVGEGGYNYSSKNIDQNSTSTSTELFAIDASNLGAIQAGRIFIIATKEGFGVKLDASLTATKTLNIDTAGNLYYTSLNARDQVNLKAKNIYSSNVNSAIKASAIEVRASAEFKNLGRLTASKINIFDSNIFNNLGITEALNLDIFGVSDVINSGTIFAQNSLGFSAVNLTNKSSGIISSTADYTLILSNLLSNSGVIYSPTNLTSNSSNIINSGSIFAEENLTLNLAGGLSNSGNVQSNGNFTLTAASLDNSSSIKSFAKSTINVAAISNNVNAVIFSQGDAEISQNNLLTNYGHILSAAKLSLDGKVLGNSGEIYSAGDLDFSLTTSLNNSGSLSALASLTLKGTSTITNSGQILSGGVFTITAPSLTNLNLIQSANNLTLNLQNLTNSKSILAQNILAINGASNVNNNTGLIQSGEGFSINSSAISNELGQFISSATINLNLGANNYSITGNILAKNIEINAADIVNLGNVNAVEYLKLTASSGNITNGSSTSNASNVKLVAGTYLELTAQNYITNYTTISAATNLTLSSTNADINNYGQITGGRGANTLKAIAINNYKSGNASFSSKITSKNDIFLNAANLVNNSKIESANNLTANISADLTNNSGGFIYANNALTFNIKNNFTNNRTGVVKSLNALIIQGSTPNSKLNQFQNISANIESLQGDITIFAKEFFNKRATQDLEIITLIKTAANKTWYEDKFEVYDNSPGNNLYRPNQGDWGWVLFDFSQPNLPYRESYRYDIFAGHSWGNGIIKTVATRREAVSSNLDSVIKAGGMFTAYSDNFTNQNGQILAVGNVTINATNFNNKATAIYQTINHQCVAKNGGTCYRLKVNSNGTRTLIDNGGNGHIFSFEAISSFISANIKSASSLVINATNNINNGDNQGEVLKDTSLKATANTHTSDTENSTTTTINPLSSYTPESAFISTIVKSVQDNGYLENIGDIAATIAAQSDLEKSTNPNAPVYESRSEFTDMSTFCSSSCLWARIKASLEAAQKAAAEAAQKAAAQLAQQAAEDSAQKAAVEAAQALAQEAASKILDQISSQQNRFFGDAAADRKLIEKQLQQIYPTNSFQNYNSSDYINSLMNNSVSVATDLQLSPGITLTKEQIENLTKDIVWIEPINMPDGTVVLAPKVYLSKTSRNNISAQNARAGATLSAKNIVISGDLLQTSLTNYGSIIASNNLSISNIDNLTQSKNSLLTAMNDLNLTINSNLLNYGTIATTGSTSNLSLTSLEGGITNKSTITSSNNLNITAAQDIKNIGAEISAANDLALKSLNGNILNTAVVQTNDANLLNSNPDSYQLRFGDAAAKSGNIYSNLVQNASLKGGNIEINAAGNFTNLAANVTAQKALFEKEGGSVATATETGDLSNSDLGNLSITAGNNINLENLQLHNHSESSWGNGKKGGTSVTDTVTNIASNINSSGSINLDSDNNITITGSNLTSSDNINLTSKNNITIQSAQDSSYSFSAGKSGKGKSYQDTSSSTSQIASNILATNGGNITLQSGIGNTDIVGSDNAQGSIFLIASSLKTSDLDANSSNNLGSGNIDLIAKEDLTITSALNTNYSEHLSGKKGFSVKKSSISIDDSTHNISSNITSLGKFSSTSGSDTNIIASNLIGQGSANILAGKYNNFDGDVVINNDAQANIFNAIDTNTSYSSTYKEKTGILNKMPATAAITSVVNSTAMGYTHRLLNLATNGAYEKAVTNSKARVNIGSTTEKIISTNLNFNNDLTIAIAKDLNIQSSNLKTTEGNISLTSGNNINITSDQANNSNYRTEDGKSDRLRSKANLEIKESASVSSQIQSGGNLGLASVNDITLQAAKLSSQDSVDINAGNNLLLLTSTDASTFSNTDSSKGTYWQSNPLEGRYNTDITNTEIASATNNLNLNADNFILAEYNQDSIGSNSNLNYLANLDPNKVILNPLTETHVDWHANNRMLTDTGTALVAVGVTAAIVLSGGTAAPVAGAATAGGTATTATAVGTAVATTAANQVVITTINNGGNLGRGIKTLDDKEVIQAMAISGLTAALSAGASQASGANATTTISPTATMSERIASETSAALTKASIGASSYSVANSLVTGQSLDESFKEKYKLENIAIAALGEVGAKEIGIAYHGTTDSNGKYINNPISQPLQLTLHGAVGCGLGSQNGNCAAGAAGAVAGELIAENYFRNKLEENGAIIEGNNVMIDPTQTDLTLNQVQHFKNTAMELAKLGGAFAAVPFAGSDDSSAIYAGSYAGGNSAGNNALRVKAQYVALGKSHLLIDHTPEPEEQKNYVNKDGYIQDKETGNWFKTWGAGPETSVLSIVGLIIDKDLTNLKSDVNRAKDINPSIKIYQSPNLVPVEQEGKYVEILNQLDKNYQDNLKYNLFPSLSNSGYNSNSYVSGLLNAAKITPPKLPSITKQYQWQDNEYPELPTIQIEYKLPLKLPGYDKPIPIKYFQGKQ